MKDAKFQHSKQRPLKGNNLKAGWEISSTRPGFKGTKRQMCDGETDGEGCTILFSKLIGKGQSASLPVCKSASLQVCKSAVCVCRTPNPPRSAQDLKAKWHSLRSSVLRYLKKQKEEEDIEIKWPFWEDLNYLRASLQNSDEDNLVWMAEEIGKPFSHSD